MIPESHLHLLTEPIVVTLVTLMPDGTPQATPVWCGYDGEHVLINTAVGRQKDRNMDKDHRVAISAIDPTNPYHWLEIRGRVIERTTEGALDHINALSQQYFGREFYAGRNAAQQGHETRVLFKIQMLEVNVG